MENIFISHIHEEAPLAIALKHWLEKTTAGQWKVFVSSDKDNITLGENWFAKIAEAQAAQKVFIVLCSPASVRRPWINYEIGCAAALGIPILPLRHSGLANSDLPLYLARYQSANIDAENFVSVLFEALQKHIPLQGEPYIPRREIADAIRQALAEIYPAPVPASTEAADSDDFEIEDAAYQTIISHLINHDAGVVTLEMIAEWLNLPTSEAQAKINALIKHGWVKPLFVGGNEPFYTLTGGGRRYTIEADMTNW